MKTIYISRAGQSLKLLLRERENNAQPGEEFTTKVEPNEIVRWELDQKSGLTEITGIRESDNTKKRYKNSQNLLDGVPQKIGDALEGRVLSKSPGQGKFEYYMIGFKVPNDPQEHWFDPKLLMI